jgi:putative transposase
VTSENNLRTQKRFKRHVDYIHYNPVKLGHVSRASEWPYSSIHRYISADAAAWCIALR